MRISDVDFILVPEWLVISTEGRAAGKPDDDHWISRWQRNFATADWLAVDAGVAPADALVGQCAAAVERPVVVITHGRAVDALLAAAERLDACPVIGAFMVAPVPSDPLSDSARLTFNSLVVGSDDHPVFNGRDAQQFASTLGSHYVAAGEAGTLDAASGQGPWPEGLMRLGWFLKQLTAH